MLEPPTQLYGKEIGSSYQQQAHTLGKHFKIPNRDGGPVPAIEDRAQQLELVSILK